MNQVTSPDQIAAYASQLQLASQGISQRGDLRNHASRYLYRADQVAFVPAGIPAEMFERARVLSFSLPVAPQEEHIDLFRAVEGLVETCPEDWIHTPTRALVVEVLNKAEQALATYSLPADSLDSLIDSLFVSSSDSSPLPC